MVINDVTATVSFSSNSAAGLFAMVSATNYNWVDKISVAWASVKVDGDENFAFVPMQSIQDQQASSGASMLRGIDQTAFVAVQEF